MSVAKEFSVNAATSAAPADILTLDNLDASKIALELVVGVNALTAFEVQVKFHSGGSFIIVANQAADFTAPSGIIAKADASLVTAAVGTHYLMLQNLEAVQAIKIRVTAAGVGTLNIKGINYPK